MQTKANGRASQKIPAAIRVLADSPEKGQTHQYDIMSVSVSYQNGDRPPYGSQVDPGANTCPKVSRA